MHYKTMDPDLIRELIANEEDVITPAIENDKVIFANAMCPVCGAQGADKVTLPPKIEITENGPQMVTSPFQADRVLPVGHARCRECGSEYTPENQVIYRVSEPVITDVQGQDPHQE